MQTEPHLPLAVVARSMAQLRSKLVDTLSRSEHPQVAGLAAKTTPLRDSDAVTLVLVGQHDAGKSSLLRCLTGRGDIEVGAGPTTTESRRYVWDGHVLVDTPGVLAGVGAAHDSLSWEALAVADVVVFVLTVEGFDDITLDYFEQVRARLVDLRNLILVVNKALSERSDRAVVADDILEALGPAFESVPLVWTDARRWLEADKRSGPDGARAESGIQDLAEALTTVARNNGAELRMQSVLRSWSDVCQEAVRQLAAGSTTDSEPALSELDDFLSALVTQRDEGLRQLEQRLEIATVYLRNGLLGAGPDIGESELSQMVTVASQLFHEDVAHDGAARDAVLEQWVPSVRAPGSEVAIPGIDLRALVQGSLSQVAKKFAGDSVRPGGAGHALVYNTWKALGGSFRPWGAVNAGKAIGQAAGQANVGLTVGFAGWELVRGLRASSAARAHAVKVREWATESQVVAEGIASPWREHAVITLESVHDVRWREVARQRFALLAGLAERDSEASNLIALGGAIDQLSGSF